MKNAYRFNGCYSCRLAAFFLIFSCGFWLLGNSFSPSLASDRITGAQAVSKMSVVLGSPEQFANNMKISTQDFIADHFGSMAIACAFGIAIRMRS
ncbi:hypothetical protein [Microcoleus sp. herbarium12]|jgi:hypothetical protein|uniref:hypothetical protein n=1 Tax=Microcoleus sp. herbarium12 TaxID=3055437 RepID=UPI002FD16D37